MKKIASIFLVLFLFLSLATPSFAAESHNYEKGIEVIEKANLEIDEKIEKAVNEAKKLQTEYLRDIRKIEEGEEVVNLQDELAKANNELAEAMKKGKDVEKFTDKIEQIEVALATQEKRINDKIAQLEKDIAEFNSSLETADGKDLKKLEAKLGKLNGKLAAKTAKAEEKTARYTAELDKIIEKVFNETLKMSEEAIEKAAKEGVVAECSWKLVQFADRSVWIDPIRIIGTR